jgi:hypothetical protein
MKRGGHGLKTLSRNVLDRLRELQQALRLLAEDRNMALRMFAASRDAATADAQREFWLEFAWADQEYRAAVSKLAQFCREHMPTKISSPAGPTPDARLET